MESQRLRYNVVQINRVQNVSYVNGRKYNLIVTSKLCDVGYEVYFNKRKGKVINQKSGTVLSASRKNDIYVLQVIKMTSHSQSHLNSLWHKRLSHLKFKSLSKISGNQLMIGTSNMKFVKDKLCSTCEKGSRQSLHSTHVLFFYH